MLRCLVYTRTSHKLRFPDPSPPAPRRRWKKKKRKKIGFRKWSPEWVFLKTLAYRFRIRWCHTSYSACPVRCYRIFIFLAFWRGQEKAIQVKPRAIWSNKLLVDSYFFENMGKNSPCWKIWGYVCTHSLPRRVRHAWGRNAWRTPKNVCVGG